MKKRLFKTYLVETILVGLIVLFLGIFLWQKYVPTDALAQPVPVPASCEEPPAKGELLIKRGHIWDEGTFKPFEQTTPKGIKPWNYQHSDLVGKNGAVVVVDGWYYEITEKPDTHLKEFKITFENVQFNSVAGRINWDTTFAFTDKNFDKTISWEAWYAVIAW